jgi:DHA1 family tetracycline resistance protein-like MFS transporter
VGEDEQGKVLGVTRSASTLARVAGPAWAGFLFTVLGKNWPFFGGAVVMIGVVLLGLWVRRQRANTS